MRTRLLAAAAALLLAAGCGQPPAGRDDTSPSVNAGATTAGAIVDREWQLVAFGSADEPVGRTARPVTMRLDSATGRVSGYTGCNGYGGPYTLRGDSLSFGPAAMTRMACAEGMDVEQRYAAMLPAVRSWRLQDAALVLHGEAGRLATFRAR